MGVAAIAAMRGHWHQGGRAMFSAMLVEKSTLLEDNGKLVAQVRQLVVAQINAVQLDLTSSRGHKRSAFRSVVTGASSFPNAHGSQEVPQKEMSRGHGGPCCMRRRRCRGSHHPRHETGLLCSTTSGAPVKKGEGSLSTGQ